MTSTDTTTTDSTMTGTYAWIVDSTPWIDSTDPDDAQFIRDGETGPHDAPAELLARFANAEGRAWRTLFDVDYDGHPADERVCHVGRYLDFHDISDPRGESVDCDAEFGPLSDLSQPDCGATEIQYQQDDGTWKTL